MSVTTQAQGLSFVQYIADGIAANFPFIFTYSDPENIKVYVDSDEVTYTYLNAAEITPVVLPTVGQVVTIRRFTNSGTRAVDFSDGGQLSESLLDLDSNQLFYLCQEALDISNFGLGVDPLSATVDARNNRIINVANGVAPTDGINMSQIADLITAVNTAGDEATQSAADAAAALLAAQVAQAAAEAIEGIAQDAEDTVNAHVLNVANPHSVTKAQVGLSDADNTSDINKPVSTAQAAAIATAKAEAKAEVLDSSPATLDTLNELAAALGDDPNFATTIATALGNRLRTDTDAQGLTSPQKVNAKTNIDLQNVDNTSDATKNAAVATITNKTIDGVNNAITNVSLTTGVQGTLPIANGGTNGTTKVTAFDSLSPMTTLGDLIIGGSAGSGTRLAVGSNGQVLTLDSGSPVWITPTAGAVKIATIKDVKTSGTNGGSYTAGSWVTRDLNTLSDPSSIITSLSSNVFTLPAGTYHIKWSSPATGVDYFTTRLYNTTDSTEALTGSAAITASGSSWPVGSLSLGDGVLTIAGAKSFRIELRGATTNAGAGALGGQNSFTTPVYTQVTIQKI